MQEELNTVHKVMQEVGSRAEARHTENSDFHRRGDEWTSKCDNRRGTSIIISLK